MKLFFVFILNALFISARAQIDTSGPVDNRFIRTVVQIKNDSGFGTGFLIKAGNRVFLATNKHMLGEWSPVDHLILYDSILVTFYTSSQPHPTVTMHVKLKENGKQLSKVVLHPNGKIDIGIVELSGELIGKPLDNNYIDTGRLMSMRIAASFITYGSHVFTIGYPAGIKSFRTNEPIVKSAFLASSMDEDLIVQQNWKNRRGQYQLVLSEGKIFLLDGLIIPGNSGGPVISNQSVEWREINGELKHLTHVKNFVLGIVSNSFSSTGITTVFSSEHILELIRKYR